MMSESSDCENGTNNFPEKNKIIRIGLLLTVASIMIFVGSIFLRSLIVQATAMFLDYFHLELDEDTLHLLEILAVSMILLAIIQMIVNISLTAAALKEKVTLIYRFNVLYTIVNMLAGCGVWILMMSIVGTCSRDNPQTMLWVSLFLGGILHSSIIVYLFLAIETQKKKLIEDAKLVKGSNNSYMKFDNPRAILKF